MSKRIHAWVIFLVVTSGSTLTNHLWAQFEVQLSALQENLRVAGEGESDSSGFSLAYGDVDMDGFDDLIVGAPTADPLERKDAGIVYVIYGDEDFTPQEHQLIELPDPTGQPGMVPHRVTIIRGAFDGDHLGWSVSAGDIDGDRFADIIVGAPFATPDSTDANGSPAFPQGGKTYVIYSQEGAVKATPFIDLAAPPSDAVTELNGAGADFRAGWSVAGGNVGLDEVDDLIIGAPFAAGGGAAMAGETYVVYGNPTLPRLPDSRLFLVSSNEQPRITLINGEDRDNKSGWAVASGDINSDNTRDVIIGAPFAEGGRAYVVSGTEGAQLPTPFDLGAPPNPIVKIAGDGRLGWSVASGNINNDEKDDLLLGAPFVGSENGVAYVFYGDLAPADLNVAASDVTIPGVDKEDRAGWSIASGDINQDGFDDIIVGAPTADSTGGRAKTGEVYLIHGSDALAGDIAGYEAFDMVVFGDDPDDLAGYAVAAGNLNKGGGDDLTLGGPGADKSIPGVGESYVIYGCIASATVAGTTEICVGESTALTVALTGAAPWTIVWSDGVTETVTASPHTRTVSPTATTTFAVNSVTDALGCTNAGTGSAVVTVHPLPTVTVSGDTMTLCAGDPAVINLDLTGTAPWQLTWSDGFTQTVFATPATRNTAPLFTTTFQVTTVVDANGCSNVGTGSATVTTNPIATFTLSADTTICAGDSAEIRVALTGVAPWTIVWSDGFTQTAVASPATRKVSPTSTTIFDIVKVTDANGCDAESETAPSVKIAVNPLPKATVRGDTTICAGDSATITVELSGLAPWTIEWSDGLTEMVLASPSQRRVSPAVKTTFSIDSVTDANGCKNTGSGSATIVVNPLPTATVTGDTTICAGDSAGIVVELTGTAPWQLTWSDGVTQTATASPAIRTVSPTTTTTLNVTTVTDANNCSNSGTGSVTITVNPLPTATLNGGDLICSGDSVTIVVDLTGAAPWQLVWSDGFTQTAAATPASRIVRPETTTTFSITQVTDANNCSNTGTGSVVVNVNPLPTATLSGSGAICAGDTVTLSVDLTGAAPWDLLWSDGFTQTAAASPATRNVSPVTTTTFSISQVTDANNCINTGTDSAVVTVNPLPTAVVSGDAAICEGQSVTINVDLTGTAPWQLVWTDGFTQTVEASPASRTVSPDTTATFGVTSVTDANNCFNVGTGSATVTVNKLPSAAFIPPSGSQFCTGQEVKFIAPAPPAGGTTVFAWDFAGEGTSAVQNPVFTFTTAGSKIVTLIVTTDYGTVVCADTASRTIEVIEAPTVNAAFSFPEGHICAGKQVEFTDESTGSVAITKWEWNFGEGTMKTRTRPPRLDGSVKHTFATAGTFDVTLIATISTPVCDVTDTLTQQVTVLPEDNRPPICNFFVDDDGNIQVHIEDNESGIHRVKVLELENGVLEDENNQFDFSDGEERFSGTVNELNLVVRSTNPQKSIRFTIEIRDNCFNATKCDPVFLTASMGQPFQNEFDLAKIDRYLYVRNEGLTSIAVQINDRTLRLLADPVRRDRQGDRQYMPLRGDLSVDILDYLTEDENRIRITLSGPTLATARLVFADAQLATTTNPFPQAFALYQNFPNPFNPSTTIEYTVPEFFTEAVKVDLIVYNIYGQRVRTLESSDKSPGVYSIVWDGRDEFGVQAASGAYVYRLRVGEFAASKRMTLVK